MANQPYENPADVAKRNSIRAVTEKTHTALLELGTSVTTDMDTLMAQSADFDGKQKRLEAEIARYAKELVRFVVDFSNRIESKRF
jgi:hypothetical protein